MGTFEDYLKFEVTEAQEDEKQLRIIEKISLSEETEKAIKGIDKDITIIAVAQVYCPDCRATVPFLKKFSDLNNKIKIDYRSRETAKEFFPDTDERIKIPTLISYVDGKYNTFWNEFPAVVKNEMDKKSFFEKIKSLVSPGNQYSYLFKFVIKAKDKEEELIYQPAIFNVKLMGAKKI